MCRANSVLILIDEIFNYIKRAIAVTIGNSDLADQTITFMQNLNGQIGSLPNVCMVVSLSNRDDVLKADNRTARTQNEYYEKLQHITGRQIQRVPVSDYNDISHIIRRRLFETDETTITVSAKGLCPQTSPVPILPGTTILPLKGADTYHGMQLDMCRADINISADVWPGAS